jgi:hypothetical protein
MPERTTYAAPWSRELFITTAIGVFAGGTPAVIQLLNGKMVIASLLIGIIAMIASLTVRGYVVTRDQLLVRRLFWTTRWPLRPGTTASVRPGVMANSWRLWGNGGFFSFTGLFSNSALGRYHAFVTDLKRTVVLETPRGLLVVSPDEPGEFASAIAEMTRPERALS